MSGQIDGGRAALAGFLYQIIGVLGLKANAHWTGQSGIASGVDALVELVRSGDLVLEALDQDAVLRTILAEGAGLTLVQFKFSSGMPPRPIYGAEYDEILLRLSESAARAEHLGESAVGYALITNRSVPGRAEPEASSRRRDPSRGAPSAHGQDGKSRRVPRATRGHPRMGEVREKICILGEIPQEIWMERLIGFASEFGCRDREFGCGIERLVARLMDAAASGRANPIEETDLIRAFTGHPSTRRMTRESLNSVARDRAGSFLEKLEHPGKPARRDKLDEISRAIRDRALVIVEGHGGCGKSTVLGSWAQSILESHAPGPGALTMVSATRDIRPNWIPEVLCDFAGLPPVDHARRHEATCDAIERLVVANPGESWPVFLLGLDGLDEVEEFPLRIRAVQEAIEWFWAEDEEVARSGRPPRAGLVVTCRRSRQVEDLWLGRGASGFPSSRQPAVIPLDDFSDPELLRAVRADLPSLYGRFYASLSRTPDSPSRLTEGLGGQTLPSLRDESAEAIGLEIVEMLRHPVIWRCLLHLTNEYRDMVLGGEAEGMRALAREFTGWFCSRARSRGIKLDDRGMSRVLARVASECGKMTGVFEYRGSWLQPSLASGLVGENVAWSLYEEADSAGYIRIDDQGRWRWRHRLCAEQLPSIVTPD